MADYVVYARSDQVSHDEWLNLRRSGIGGSDAGAIMGVNPYKGPFAVYADKMGSNATVDDTEAMRQGRDLEEYVAQRFAEATGKKVRRDYSMMRSLHHPFMVANIDRRIVGERAGLECKTSRDVFMSRYRNGDYPTEYYCQCLHYMAVTGWDRWYLAVLVYGTKLMIYDFVRAELFWQTGPVTYDSDGEVLIHHVPVDQSEFDMLVQSEESFWANYVQGDRAPATDGLDSTTRALGAMYEEETPGSWVDADGEAERRILDLSALMDEKKLLESRIEETKNAIKAAMGEAEELRGCYGRATWKTQTRRTISEKLLRAAVPGLDIDTVRTVSSSRVFRLVTDDESEE